MNLKRVYKMVDKKLWYWLALRLDGRYDLVSLNGNIVLSVYGRYEAELATKALKGRGLTIVGNIPWVMRNEE